MHQTSVAEAACVSRRAGIASAVLALVGSALFACALTGCSTRTPQSVVATSTSTRTVLATVAAPPPTYVVPRPTTVAPLSPGATPNAGESERRCPYIHSSQQDGADSVADIIGSHVYRTTVLASRPVGCRFYFYAAPYEAIADIVAQTFATHRAAYNAMVLIGRAGADAIGQPRIVGGVDAVLYRTRFFGADGARDWACVFAAGKVLVVVHTQRDETSYPALQLARVIAPQFARR
jgi:hypothetical protein